jgi:virginiamycin B lyase
VGVAALVLFGACARGAPEQRVASRGSEPGEATEAFLPVEIPTAPTTAGEVIPIPVLEPTTTTTSPPAASGPTTTVGPGAGDPCGTPTVTDFPLSAAGGQPAELAVAPDGAVWFTDNGTAAVGRLAPDGTVRMFPVSGGRQPASIAIGPTGAIWFTQYAWQNVSAPGSPPLPPPDPPAIGRISAAGTVTEFPLPTTDGNPMGDPMSGALPRGITAGPDGAMWFTESGADRIGRISGDGTVTEYPLPSRGTIHAFPDGIVPGPDGALYFQEALAGRLGRIDPATGAISERQITPSGSGPMGRAVGGPLVDGPDGAFWFGDGATTITRVTTAGKPTSFRVAPPADGIRSMVAGPDGRLWFADQRSPALFRMTTTGDVSRLWTPPGAPKAYESLGGMAVGGGSVWVTQPWANKITRLSCPGIGADSSPADPANV